MTCIQHIFGLLDFKSVLGLLFKNFSPLKTLSSEYRLALFVLGVFLSALLCCLLRDIYLHVEGQTKCGSFLFPSGNLLEKCIFLD